MIYSILLVTVMVGNILHVPKRAMASISRGIHSKACSGLDIAKDPLQSALQSRYCEGSIPKRALALASQGIHSKARYGLDAVADRV